MVDNGSWRPLRCIIPLYKLVAQILKCFNDSSLANISVLLFKDASSVPVSHLTSSCSSTSVLLTRYQVINGSS